MSVVLDVSLLDDLVPEGEGEVGVVLVHHVGGHDVDGRLEEVNSVECQQTCYNGLFYGFVVLQGVSSQV